MKKLFYTIPVVVLIILGTYMVPRVSAALPDTVAFGSLAVTAISETSITLKGTVTYQNSQKTGTVPDFAKDLKFRYATFDGGFGFPWSDITIKDADIKATYNQPASVVVTVSGLNPDFYYTGYFMELTPVPDYDGKKSIFRTDKFAVYDESATWPTVASNLSSTTASISRYALFSNSKAATQPNAKPLNKMHMRLYNEAMTKMIYDIPFPHNTCGYNERCTFNNGFQGLTPGTVYKVVLYEELRKSTSKATSFKTPASTSNTSSTPNTNNTNTNTNTTTNTSSNTSSSSTTNTTSSNTSSSNTAPTGLIRFSAVGTSYTGTKVSGSITPTISGSTLTIDGDLTYSKITGNPATAQVANLGRTSFHLVDGSGVTSQILVDEMGGGSNLSYDVPYTFRKTFANYDKYLDQNGKPTSIQTRPAPFKLQIREDQLDARTELLTVATSANSSSSSSSNQISDDNQSTATASNGVSTTFSTSDITVDAAKKTATIVGSITYGRDLTGSELADKVGEIQGTLYSSTGSVVQQGIKATFARIANSYKQYAISLTFTGIDPTKAYTFIIKDHAFDVSSDEFDIPKSSSSSTPSNSSASGGMQTSTDWNDAGVQAIFTIESTLYDSTAKTFAVKGTVDYNTTVTSTKTGKVLLDIYDSKDQRIASKNINFTLSNGNHSISFNQTFGSMGNPSSPLTFKIRDTDVNIESDQFDTCEQGGCSMVLQNGGYSSSGEKAGTMSDGTTVKFSGITLTNPNPTTPSFGTTITFTKTGKNGQTVPAQKVSYTITPDNGTTITGTIDITSAKYNIATPVPFTTPTLDLAKKYKLQFTQSSGAKTGTFDFDPAAMKQQAAAAANQNPDAEKRDRVFLHNPLKEGLDTIPAIVEALVDNVVLPIAVPLLALAIIYTGFLFVTAKGNPKKIETAKLALRWTIIGGAVILGAYVLATALQGTLKAIVA